MEIIIIILSLNIMNLFFKFYFIFQILSVMFGRQHLVVMLEIVKNHSR